MNFRIKRPEPEWGNIDRFYQLLLGASVHSDTKRIYVLKKLAKKHLSAHDYQLLRSDISFMAQMGKQDNVA